MEKYLSKGENELLKSIEYAMIKNRNYYFINRRKGGTLKGENIK